MDSSAKRVPLSLIPGPRRVRGFALFLFLLVGGAPITGSPLAAQEEGGEVIDLTLERMVDLALSSSYQIRRLNLEINPGEVLSLLGMGSWERRTLVDLVTALASPDAGTIRFQGTDLGTKKERDLNPLRGRMGVVTDPPVFLGNLKIMENLRLPLRYHAGGDESS